jgi:aspartyl-tRNA(Asn)/glutamyl-tRNA(Gln) amidotransferase subunit B
MDYEVVIGLEVHLQLKTKTKAFCGCSTEFGKGPNSQVCPVCLGFPGSLPVFNKTALDYAIKVALALNCKIQEYTKFDRKNYFYPDLPKAFQISQYDLPLSRGGFIDIEVNAAAKRIGITRVHMEEDAGKLIHQENSSLVDYNRTGIPLLEIVSEPDMRSSEEAYEYLMSLKSIIEYLDVSDCDMEKGSLRCDANISLRESGAKEFGTKAELKNMNSFKAVKDALNFEITRQAQALDNAERIIQETRLWDERSQQTFTMRTKEEAQDYRYFPEPDLPPFIISGIKVEEIRGDICELPHEKMLRFMKEFGLSEYDANILVASKKDAEFAEELMRLYPDGNKKPIVNWLIGPVAAVASSNSVCIHQLVIPGGKGELIKLVKSAEDGKISNLTAKSVFNKSISCGATSSDIIERENLSQVSDADSLIPIVDEAIKDNPKFVNDYKAGKTNVIMALVGQVMKKSGGKANPNVVQELLKRRLKNA